jgi:hypothetical protein
MLKFNTLLNECGINPADVQLVRHKDRGPTDITSYSLFRSGPDYFNAYQSLQGRRVFHRQFIASFVVCPAPSYDTLFVGLYRVSEPQKNKETITCPIRLKPFEPERLYVYPLTLDEKLQNLIQLLTINWGDGYRSWVQRAAKQNKDVLEIRRRAEEPTFPGYLHFRDNIENIPLLYSEWRAVLTEAKGIYLLVCNKTGAQYVGSASGEKGFFGRWLAYAADGHGGNKLLKERAHKDYKVSILETVGTNAQRDEILKREALWKEKLGSRAERLGDAFGLNAN